MKCIPQGTDYNEAIACSIVTLEISMYFACIKKFLQGNIA